MLYIENGEVKVTDDGMCLPEVQALYKTDNTHSSKPFFKKCITYIYWGYKKDGEWANHLPKKRLEMASKLAEVSLQDIKNNAKVQAVIKVYIENQTTLTERLYLGVKKDIEEILEMINNIPFERDIKVEMMIDIPEYEGSDRMIKYPIKQWVRVDNSEEKEKAIRRVEKLIELEEKLRKKIIKEYQENKVFKGRMFDNRQSND